MKPTTMNRYKHHQGSTTLGIIVGIVLGLIVALGVSLYLATSNMPIKDKAANPGAKQDSLVKTENGLPDPNASLYGKPKDDTGLAGAPSSNTGNTANTAAGLPSAPTAKPEDDPIGKIAAIATPTKPVPAPAVVAAPAAQVAPKPAASTPAPVTPAAPAKPAAVAAGAIAMPPASLPGSGGERFFVQAGAFKELAPAESLKAKLALQGVVMVISPKESPSGPLHRVRTLPLAAKDAQALQTQLKVNGIDTTLVKVQ